MVTKSTVPVGTSFKVKSLIADALSRRGATIDFDIANNPEFLKEGAAIKDFMSPDRVVIGVENERAEKIMQRLYKPFIVVNDRIQITDIASSEMIKYASNAMLATRISFMNDIANLCELVGADFNKVRKGVGSDLTFAPDKYTALQHSDALLLVTEWKEFRLPDFLRMRSLMRTPLLLDGRNIFDRDEVLSAGFEYEKIG